MPSRSQLHSPHGRRPAVSDPEYNAARRAKGLRAVTQGLNINLDLEVAIVCLNHAADKIEELEIERNELRSDLEFRRGLFQLQEHQLNDVRKERDEWKQKFIQQNKDLGCEMMDPGGTIWDYAKKLQADIAGWETKWKCAVEMAAVAENERDELKEKLDAAIMLGKMQERELEQVREQYRLSSVCRKLLLENQQLKESRQSPTTNQ